MRWFEDSDGKPRSPSPSEPYGRFVKEFQMGWTMMAHPEDQWDFWIGLQIVLRKSQEWNQLKEAK